MTVTESERESGLVDVCVWWFFLILSLNLRFIKLEDYKFEGSIACKRYMVSVTPPKYRSRITAGRDFHGSKVTVTLNYLYMNHLKMYL